MTREDHKEQICPVCKISYRGYDWQILCIKCYRKYCSRLPAEVVKKIALDGKMDLINSSEKVEYLVRTGYLKED